MHHPLETFSVTASVWRKVCTVERGLRTPSWNGGGYRLQIYLNIHGASSILIFSFFKRWLCFPVWQPLRKEESFLPCTVQLSRTNLGWKPLRPPGLFIIHKCCKPASWIHLDSSCSFVQFLIPLLSLPGKKQGAQASCKDGVWRWALFGLGNALRDFVFSKFWLFYHWICSAFPGPFRECSLRTVNCCKGICGLWQGELSKMPEANYLLTVSWGYIKVG